MFFVALLFSLSLSLKRICICNGICSSICSTDVYDASSNLDFEDFIFPQIQNEAEIELILYSKQNGFVFPIKPTYFNDIKVSISVPSESQPISIQIKRKFQLFYKNIEIQPNHKIILPNLIPFPSTISSAKKNILESPISTPIPISVSLLTMNREGTSECNPGPESQKQDNHLITDYTSVQALGCTKNLANDKTCGIRCWGNNVNYSYTFKGVKFAVYGTNDPGHDKYDIELDGGFLAQVNQHTSGRQEYALQYTSELLEYREHTVRLVARGMCEFYKLVYWPSVHVRRINSTELALHGSSWKDETDGIGGIRHYKDTDSTAYATITLNCSRFWVYGLKEHTVTDLTFSYHNVTESFEIHQTGRLENVLLYESPRMDIFNFELTISSVNVLMISSIYIEEPPIPMSVGISQMNREGTIECNYYTKSGSVNPNDINSLNTGCPTNNLGSLNAYSCGIKCWGDNGKYHYTFRGVKFAVYGTYKTGHGEIEIELDGQNITRVDQGQKNIPGPQLLYESHYLEYGDHTIGYIGIGQNNEFYKFVFWPSLNARRLNSTEFTSKEEKDSKKYEKETDDIGGVREYKSPPNYVLIKLRCSKFWLYGTRNTAMGTVNLRYKGKSVPLNFHSETRKNGDLLYESDNFQYSEVLVSLHDSTGNLNLNCIYYEEPPNPMITPIPISVTLSQMYTEGSIENCGNKANNQFGINEDEQSIGCDYNNLNTEAAYKCGLRCWGTGMKYSYTFRGVKFALYGTISTEFGSSILEFDKQRVEIYQKAEVKNLYILLYESDVLPYRDHTVNIQPKNSEKYELYKLVYWPSLKSRRINSTDFTRTGTWHDQSDAIGGVRSYTAANTGTGTFTKTFPTTKFWMYGSTYDWAEGMDVTYLGKTYFLSQLTDKRYNYVLHIESPEVDYQNITLSGQTKGDSTLSCVYYTYEHDVFEYINKTFERALPYFHIHVKPNSIINEISGCKFIGIAENFDYYITLEKEVVFHDNIFQNENEPETVTSPINIKFNGRLTIENCVFKKMVARYEYLSNSIYVSEGYACELKLQSCQFIQCGKFVRGSIIQCYSEDSIINIDNCTFNECVALCKVLLTYSQNVVITRSTFYKTSGVEIRPRKTSLRILDDKAGNFEVTYCTFDSCISDKSVYSTYYLELTRTSTVTFENNEIKNIQQMEEAIGILSIDLNKKIETLLLKNITFSNNHCRSKYGGGNGIILKDVPKAVFADCAFENNEAHKSGIVIPSYDIYNGDGGAVQLGLFCSYNEGAVKFEKCTFKSNKAEKNGGALSIQTLNTVEIIDCIFQGNKANADFSSSSTLLFDNHFDKKTGGRGGAIYINPTYSYKVDFACFDPELYMTDVTIDNCTFSENSGYDGYAIYVEGDDGGTVFDIRNNKFENNYNYGSSYANDPNKTIRGVIATEIHTISENVVHQNSFIINKADYAKPKKLTYVDHYGNRVATKAFTESGAFTDSQYFTFSNKFTETQPFSHTSAFTETQPFSHTRAFTESNDFTKSQDFLPSDPFSKSKEFSQTNKFTATSYFSETDSFTESRRFTKSSPFEPTYDFDRTRNFTPSSTFTKSKTFTSSADFSHSLNFSPSFKFSKSEAFEPSDKFTRTAGFSPSSEFSETESFSKTTEFTKTENFSPSTEFSKTVGFSPSTGFSKTVGFSPSTGFTKTAVFSQSTEFTKTAAFSQSTEFSKSENFYPFTHLTSSSDGDDVDKPEEFSSLVSSSSSSSSSNEGEGDDKISSVSSFDSSSSREEEEDKDKDKDDEHVKTTTENPVDRVSSVLTQEKTPIPAGSSSTHTDIHPFTYQQTQSKAQQDGAADPMIKKNKSISIPLIVGLIVGILALIAIIIFIILFVRKKKREKKEDTENHSDASFEVSQAQQSENMNEFANPLYDQQVKEDPFDQAFEEEI